LIPGLLSIKVELDRKEPAAPVPDQQSELPELRENSERSNDSVEGKETESMRKKTVPILCAAILLGVFSVQAQGVPRSFDGLLRPNGMQYALPPGFTVTPVVENGDVVYDFAIKSSTSKLEIRYRIWPVDMTNRGGANRNRIYPLMVRTMGLNISNGQTMQIKQYDPGDVRMEFGADGGATGTVRLDSKFGEGYKICMISVIHKDDLCDAYTFFLCDDPDVLMKALFADRVYHALRFR
jgi:hypothetical protein